MDLHHISCGSSTTQTLRQQYLSCYWPDLDQTLNKGSWENIQQIKSVTKTFVQVTFVLGTFVHISNIWPDLDQILNKGSREHIQQNTTGNTTFVLGTFVHIRNISAVTGPIWIKL